MFCYRHTSCNYSKLKNDQIIILQMTRERSHKHYFCPNHVEAIDEAFEQDMIIFLS